MSARRFQIPAARLLHQLLQFDGEYAREFGGLVEWHLKDCAKLRLSGLLGLHDDFRKLHFAYIQPCQFGAFAPQRLLQQIVLTSCRIPPSSGGRPRVESVILTPSATALSLSNSVPQMTNRYVTRHVPRVNGAGAPRAVSSQGGVNLSEIVEVAGGNRTGGRLPRSH
jgi:hypothetical protein